MYWCNSNAKVRLLQKVVRSTVILCILLKGQFLLTISCFYHNGRWFCCSADVSSRSICVLLMLASFSQAIHVLVCFHCSFYVFTRRLLTWQFCSLPKANSNIIYMMRSAIILCISHFWSFVCTIFPTKA